MKSNNVLHDISSATEMPAPSPTIATAKPLASPPLGKRLSNEDWVIQAVEGMNGLDKNPDLVSVLSKRGF